MPKYILVEAITMFRERFVFELKDDDPIEYALDSMLDENKKEFSQKFLDEVVSSTREVTLEELEKIFKEDNEFKLPSNKEIYINAQVV